MSFLTTDAYILARAQQLAHWVQRTYGVTNFQLARWCLFLTLLGCGTSLLRDYYTTPTPTSGDILIWCFMGATVLMSYLPILSMLQREDDQPRDRFRWNIWRAQDENQRLYRLIAAGMTLWIALFLVFFPSPMLSFAFCFGAGLSCAAYLSACTPQ